MLAIGTRILLLLSLSWIIGLTEPIFSFLGYAISGRDIILIVGGLFLIGKSTHEIHEKLEGEEEQVSSGGQKRNGLSFASVIIHILLLDVVFSLDSVITAVGMVDQLSVMIAAVVVSACAMVFLTGVISDFVNRHPTVKMLALSFLLLIGFTLLVEGLHQRSRQHGEVSLKSSSGCSGTRRWSGPSLVPLCTAFSAARANKPLAV